MTAPECFDRHAPQGYRIAMQFFDGETREEALAAVCATLKVDPADVALVPGCFRLRARYRDVFAAEAWVFQPAGWMAFLRVEGFPDIRARIFGEEDP